MSLVPRVVEVLRDHGFRHAVIGAVALAARGVVRATGDFDLLCIDRGALNPQAWSEIEIARATAVEIVGAKLPVVEAADLVVLKLYAGGPQDAWDIDQLLDRDTGITTLVDDRVRDLPHDAQTLWTRIKNERRPS